MLRCWKKKVMAPILSADFLKLENFGVGPSKGDCHPVDCCWQWTLWTFTDLVHHYLIALNYCQCETQLETALTSFSRVHFKSRREGRVDLRNEKAVQHWLQRSLSQLGQGETPSPLSTCIINRTHTHKPLVIKRCAWQDVKSRTYSEPHSNLLPPYNWHLHTDILLHMSWNASLLFKTGKLPNCKYFCMEPRKKYVLWDGYGYIN